MAAASSRRSSSGPMMRSLSPSGRFCNSHYASSSSSAFAYSSSSFSARSSTFFNRSASPTRVNLCGNNKPAQTTSAHSVRFVSPNRSNSITSTSTSSRNNQILKNHTATTTATKQKRTCMCSPTTHPGSFRCSLHKNNSSSSSNYSPNNRLDARRSAMKNSLVRIGGVEGDLVKRALAALIRPSSHQQKRRAGFQQRPSRLSIMSKAEDDLS
ncbi:hypothetical protein LWI28_012785 [Acer negundo]|uniref:Serine-rich protein-like protein n=1 Tax=Acer negundo TaxID=4023 RepID=A0AAD5JB91_ACENE|nr:hypothetical protein LWI28_012785 [Acer negundo]KAK4854657.1 hypothetical protein QYF36_027327 [Acer negundo]